MEENGERYSCISATDMYLQRVPHSTNLRLKNWCAGEAIRFSAKKSSPPFFSALYISATAFACFSLFGGEPIAPSTDLKRTISNMLEYGISIASSERYSI